MKIVMVDDSKIMLNVAMDIIEESEISCSLRTFLDPVEALEYIKKNAVDLVITDLVMPKLTGLEFIEAVKSHEQLMHIKMLIVTSIDDSTKLSQAFDLGASDYITKPYNDYEFLARIKNAIREIKLTKELAIQLKRTKEEHKKLYIANERLRVTQAQLIQKEKMAGIGQLAAGVAHEINNPLGFILSNFETLKEYISFIRELMKKYDDLGITDDSINQFKQSHDYEFIVNDIYEIIEDTNAGLDRVKEIIKSLRSFSRIDAFKEFVKYNLNEGIEETLIIAKNEYKYVAAIEKNLGEIPDVEAYAGEINQVILNIIINAVHAIKENKGKIDHGLIKIKTELINDESVHLSITDNGCGMDESTKSKIFDPFFTTKDVGVGTGLGLSITYDIITNKHSGSIEVESYKDIGTTINISLPLKQS
ncbi:MAG TPA: response regulator [Clostridia bacterium]|nr:response regulator [Clostridia bacterium]